MKTYNLKEWPEIILWSLQHKVSRLIGWVANCEVKWFKNLLIQRFIAWYQVDVTICTKNTKDYVNLNDFFTRRLNENHRPMSSDPKTVVSPVDGVISQIGPIQEGQLIQAKGFSYTLDALLGGNQALSNRFKDGYFATFYLAPKDYHRVHMPLTGTLEHMIYVPGSLFSVNKKSTKTHQNLFTRNERVISIFEVETGSEKGYMAIIQVAALLVGKIGTSWEKSTIDPGKYREIKNWDYTKSSPSDRTLSRGQEMGYFELGSTVILVFTKDLLTLEERLKQENDCIVQCKASIGIIH